MDHWIDGIPNRWMSGLLDFWIDFVASMWFCTANVILKDVPMRSIGTRKIAHCMTPKFHYSKNPLLHHSTSPSIPCPPAPPHPLTISPISWRKLNTALILSCLALFSCARQIPPTGGPPDKKPPEIINTVPSQSAVRVPVETSIELEFSEKIDRDTFAEAIFISPDPGGELRFKHKGQKAQIVLPKALLSDRTYVVTVGTDLRDNHNVAMAESFTLAFSTGDSIDRGEIAGRVFTDKPQGILLWAYILPDSADSTVIDPKQRGGDYVTQAGVKGEYRIPFIAGGKYRVFAVNDQARNGIYDPVEDQIGVPDRDVEIMAEQLRVGNLDFRLTQEDTIRPGLSSASLVNNSMIEVRFDEEMKIPDSLWVDHFSLFNTATKTFVALKDATVFPLDHKLFYIHTDLLDSVVSLVLEAKNVADLTGNVIDTAFAKYEFGGTAKQDTIRPKILRFSPEDSSTGITLDQQIRLIFSEWMLQPDSAIGLTVRITDTSRAGVPGKLVWQNPFELAFQPDTTWRSRTRYYIEIDRSQIRDLAGNALFDTLAIRTFTTLNVDTLSAISGTLETTIDLPDSVMIFMKAKQVEGDKNERELWLKSPGAFEFGGLLPGVYLIEGFFDTTPNQKYDFGQAFPFTRSERFFVYPDSIKIRSRWPNEGNDIAIEK